MVVVLPCPSLCFEVLADLVAVSVPGKVASCHKLH